MGAETSDALTGFAHNAVSPLGMRTHIPVLVCAKIAQMRPAFVYLGAGEPDLKLGLSTEALIRATSATVVDLSDSRTADTPDDDG